MSRQEVAAALQRVARVLERRPAVGLKDDAPAGVRWLGGTRTVATHVNGTQVETEMPPELGGRGDAVSPGWLFRAGIASCAATSIALLAATEDVELTELDVCVRSRSDTRAIVGVRDADGSEVSAQPGDVTLAVRIAARDRDPAALRDLVAAALRRSPIPSAVSAATPIAITVDVLAADVAGTSGAPRERADAQPSGPDGSQA